MSKEGERDFRKEYLTGDDKAWLTHICFNGGGLNYIDYDWNNELLDEIDRLRGANKMLQDMVEKKDEYIKHYKHSTEVRREYLDERIEQLEEELQDMTEQRDILESGIIHKRDYDEVIKAHDETIEWQKGKIEQLEKELEQYKSVANEYDHVIDSLNKVEKERDQYKNALELLLGDIENYSEEDYPGENKKWVMEILRKNGLIPDEEKEDD